MIEGISIQDSACYAGTPQDLHQLSQHNFIFGSNGTGKTTISRIIADENYAPSCAVSWRGGTKLETLVYNCDFVSQNFEQPSELKGIFTLGEKDKDTILKIETAKAELDTIEREIQTLTKTLSGDDGEGGKRAELREIESALEDKAWLLKQKHDAKFKDAFTGFRGSRRSFKDKLITEATTNSAELKPLTELEQKAEVVFGKAPEAATVISLPAYGDIIELESAPILQKKVVGKVDVDIAAMIQRLGNSDWVKQGRVYYESNDMICPFCQQNTTDSFAASLAEYFDETFEADTRAIETLVSSYKLHADNLLQSLSQIEATPSDFLDLEDFKSKVALVEAKIRTNLQQVQKKRNEPSRRISLETLSIILADVKAIIDMANKAIRKHNAMVADLDREKRQLRSQVWKYLLEIEIKTELAAYNKSKGGCLKAIQSLEKQIDDKKKIKSEKAAEIRELEKSTTSIQPTIDAINSILASFGFNNFTLAKSGRDRFYKLVRPDGTDAKDTLSEGERNFVTFLYFYHRLKGSESEIGTTTDRVVVFDDPVSSLDSDVLFIVSTLIKGLFDEIRGGSGNIKQIFILTHNVFFHKEVTFNKKRNSNYKLRDETFWTVRKSDDTSVVERHECNPIKTSYELMWTEVREHGRSNLGIQNTLRRILENYFTILGNVDPDTMCGYFEGKEKLICKSLFSWVNAGSHYALDDLYVSGDGTSVDSYLTVFRKIFEESGHLAHYNMMMGEEYTEEAA